MRKIIFFFVPVLCMGIFSCQKQIDWGMGTTPTNNTGGGTTTPPSTNGELVMKVYGKAPTGLDSNVSLYTYNSAKKVIALKTNILIYASSSTLSSSVYTWSGYERNAAGLIVLSKKYQENSTNPIPLDTTVTQYYYTTGSSPVLKYSTSSANLLGFTFTDSTVYTFNSGGRITKSESYQSSFLSTTPELSSRVLYTYDAAGNPIKTEQYSILSGATTLASTQSFQWDNKNPPLVYTEAESVIITGQSSPIHNPTSVTIVAANTNSSNTFTYTYNSAGKPATSVLRAVNTNFPTETTNFTIYYQ